MAEQTQPLVTVKALSNILHDGNDYKEGESLDVTEAQAEALIEAGVAKKGREAKEAEVVKDSPKTDKK